MLYNATIHYSWIFFFVLSYNLCSLRQSMYISYNTLYIIILYIYIYMYIYINIIHLYHIYIYIYIYIYINIIHLYHICIYIQFFQINHKSCFTPIKMIVNKRYKLVALHKCQYIYYIYTHEYHTYIIYIYTYIYILYIYIQIFPISHKSCFTPVKADLKQTIQVSSFA